MSQASPLYKALHNPWCHLCFWFLTGKSSWVPSRTQGLFPPVAGSRFVLVAASIVFAMWAWRLYHMGMVSVVSLLVCFCRMWLCTGSIWLKNGFRNYVASANLYFGFVIKIIVLRCMRLLLNYVTSVVLCWIITIWLLSVWFEIPRDFVDYRSYMGSSVRIWSLRWLFLYLCSYNLDGSVTAGIGARFNSKHIIYVFKQKFLWKILILN
jgi:hypothetical protein